MKLKAEMKDRRLRKIHGFWLRRREDWPWKLVLAALALMFVFVAFMTIHEANRAVKNSPRIEEHR